MGPEEQVKVLPSPEQHQNLFYARHSIRGFDKNRDVPDEVVSNILDMA